MRSTMYLTLLTAGLIAAPASAQYPYSPPGYGNDADANTLVGSWYLKFLGRTPDAGRAYWVRQLQAGNAPETVLAGILGSDEYYVRGGSTPEGFVQRLFADVAG